ncbi:hypothetical protein HID58_041509, partial [Brassica napus]
TIEDVLRRQWNHGSPASPLPTFSLDVPLFKSKVSVHWSSGDSDTSCFRCLLYYLCHPVSTMFQICLSNPWICVSQLPHLGASPARRSFPTSLSIFSWESTRPNMFLQSLRGQASTGDASLSCSILSILHVWPPPLFRSVNLCMKRPPEDPYRQPPQTYLLSQRFANLASNVGGNPLRRPDLSHQKLVRPCCRRTTLTSSYCVALQRIEAEKKRHDDRRGYSRSDVPRTTFKPSSDSRSYSRREVSRVDSGRYYVRKENQTREHSILSRTAKSNSAYYRNNAPSFQYQAVERNRTSSDSSASRQIPMPQPVAPETRGDTPNNPGTYPQNVQSGEITPTRTLRERLGPTSAGTTSGSKERRSALARISEPPATTEQPARRTPSFESGRLQLNDNRATEAATDQGNMEPLSEERLPATLRLGSSITAPPTRRGIIPISPQNKEAGKRRVSKTPRRVVRRPRLIQSIRKPTEARSTTVTKRRLVVDKDPTLPCNKAGTSNAVSNASGTMARRRRLYQPFRSMFLCSSPKFLSIGALVVLSRLKDSSTMLFSGESQIVTLVAFGQASTGDASLSCSILSILHVWPPPLFRSVNLGMKRPPEDPYRQPPQTYLLSQRFANLASNVGGNPLRRPDFSHQKLVRPCCRRTTLTSSYVVESTSLPCFLFKN